MSRDLLNEYNALAAKVGKPIFKVWNLSYEELVNRVKTLRKESNMDATNTNGAKVEDMTNTNNTSPYQVEKGIPVPEPRQARLPTYPFAQMDVGDSFEAPVAERLRVYSARLAYSKKTGTKFRAKSADGKVRVWRIA